ncbi:MAG: serine/threonine-protein phosphatase [Deltaproteobacteria bacterium]|nr:serine/threonine-protein phosphatase [Deltaproteobacteria bacterium]MBW2072546.1 serine/threonine-protein phosphatase [Deltaproteobacteria bacterium]
MNTFGITHKGLVRTKNQDRFFVQEFPDGSVLLAVADGLGGQEGGDRASAIAKESLHNFDPALEDIGRHLVELMRLADEEIRQTAENEPQLKGMGTTMTAAYVRQDTVYWAHVGDSRLYLFRQELLSQITEDNTMAGFLLAEGQLTKEEARVHPGRMFLFECVGCGDFEVDTGQFRIKDGDLLLLSTDGLHDEVPESIIVSLLKTKDSLEKKLAALVNAALNRGGSDNIAIVGLEM